jgi:hypothetical protein
MKAYEFTAEITPEGKLDIPSALAEMLPPGRSVRLLILIDEPKDTNEQAAWSRLTAEQFLAGYGESDSIYDMLS